MYSQIFFVLSVIFLVGFPVNHSMPAQPEWPIICRHKSYCPIKPVNYPQTEIDTLLKGMILDLYQYNGMTNRSGSAKDVAGCASLMLYQPLYLIKDMNEQIRFVAQNKDFSVMTQIEECREPGRKLYSNTLDKDLLHDQRVDCFETRLPLRFLVLSLDRTSLESVEPKGGISVSCSAKVMNSS